MKKKINLSMNCSKIIRSRNEIKYVVKNGRLYNAETMDQIWPKKEKLKELWWWNDGP